MTGFDSGGSRLFGLDSMYADAYWHAIAKVERKQAADLKRRRRIQRLHIAACKNFMRAVVAKAKQYLLNLS